MKKVIAILAIGMIFAAPAFAQIGLGYDTADNGISVKFPAGPVGIEGVVGFESISPEASGADTETTFGIAAYVAYPFITADTAKLNFFGGIGLYTSSESMTIGAKEYDKDLDFAIRLGLEPEVMVTDNFGVSAKTGLEIYMNQGYKDVDDSGSTNIGFWGGVAGHWYFK